MPTTDFVRKDDKITFTEKNYKSKVMSNYFIVRPKVDQRAGLYLVCRT